jgi:sugar fermentation stimulation protein A
MKLEALIEGRLLRETRDTGVELLAWGAEPTTAELTLNRQLEVIL